MANASPIFESDRSRDEQRNSVAAARARSSVASVIGTTFRTALRGPFAEELRVAQRTVVLSRTNVLIWISVFVMPSAILSYVYFLSRPQLGRATAIVSVAIGLVLLHCWLIARGAFDRMYHLAMLLLVGGVFGPTGTAIVEITRNGAGNFLFAFYLIYFAFTALFPAEIGWILLTSVVIAASYVSGRFLHMGSLQLDSDLIQSLIYFGELTFIGTVLNRVVYRLFFDERRAQIELARANSALRELDRAKSSFFSNISHEIRTPLTLILTPLTHILQTRRGELSPELAATLEGVRGSASRLLKMVNSLLDFAKLEAGGAKVSLEELDIEAVAKDAAKLFTAIAESRGLTLVVEAEAGALTVRSDLDKLEKILVNLLGNAVKFTPSGGRITLRITRVGSDFELRIRDTGVGIPKAQQDAVFERFTQLENAQQTSTRGTGIGLAMVREYARLLGGEVTLASEVGEGSTFTVRLPIAGPSGAALRVSDVSSSPRIEQEELAVADLVDMREEHLPLREASRPGEGRLRVLIVDDNVALVGLVSSILERDYNLFMACDGDQALECLAREKVDLVVSDVMMPRVSGLELVRRMRADERTRHLPVILLTARGGTVEKVEGLEVGADDYIGKPFDPNELRARVRSLFELRRTSQALAVKSDGLERALVRLKAEELKVIESEKLRSLGELAAGIFHELHNHLNIICNGAVPLAEGLTDLAASLARENGGLRDDLKEDLAGTRELATHVLAAAQAARGVTSELKGYAYQDNQVAVSDLNSIIESTVRIFGTLRGGGHVKLALAPGPVPVHCTPTRLQQVFTNLIKNAIEAMNGSGEVTIETSIEGRLVLATVTDNGPGIAPSNQAKLFEPFFTTKRQGEGLGLGLSLSRKVLHDFGGDLRYDSAHVGGASFVLTLPFGEGRDLRASSPPPRDVSPQA